MFLHLYFLTNYVTHIVDEREAAWQTNAYSKAGSFLSESKMCKCTGNSHNVQHIRLMFVCLFMQEQHSENKHSTLRNTRSSEALSEFSLDSQRDLSAHCSSNEAASLAFSGDESDKQVSVA